MERSAEDKARSARNQRRLEQCGCCGQMWQPETRLLDGHLDDDDPQLHRAALTVARLAADELERRASEAEAVLPGLLDQAEIELRDAMLHIDEDWGGDLADMCHDLSSPDGVGEGVELGVDADGVSVTIVAWTQDPRCTDGWESLEASRTVEVSR